MANQLAGIREPNLLSKIKQPSSNQQREKRAIRDTAGFNGYCVAPCERFASVYLVSHLLNQVRTEDRLVFANGKETRRGRALYEIQATTASKKREIFGDSYDKITP
jgi:hypothetical protein